MKKFVIFVFIILIAVGIGAFIILKITAPPAPFEPKPPMEKTSADSPFGGLLFFSLASPIGEGYPAPKPDDFDFKPTKDLGLKWGRAHYLTWSMVQPTKTAIDNKIYDWSDSDSVLGAYPEGFNVLENIVAFSAKMDETGEHLENFSFSTKNDEENYARFVEKAVERYDGDGKDDIPHLKKKLKNFQNVLKFRPSWRKMPQCFQEH